MQTIVLTPETLILRIGTRFRIQCTIAEISYTREVESLQEQRLADHKTRFEALVKQRRGTTAPPPKTQTTGEIQLTDTTLRAIKVVGDAVKSGKLRL